MWKWLLIVVLALPVVAVLAGRLGLLQGRAPDNLGVREGKLKPPSKTPNSVSSQADLWPDNPQCSYARIAPLALLGGDGPATIARLKSLVQSTPGAAVVLARSDYLQATFSTPLMRYTDDAEFWFDPAAAVVQVRSASRLGRRDFEANRKRVEALRSALAAPAR